jgi:regulator of nucleoside diphosphate kinase
MTLRTIVINSFDASRLYDLIEQNAIAGGAYQRELDALRAELQNAEIVAPGEVPDDVVTMNSTVVLRDIETDERETYTLVFPEDAAPGMGRMSILAPLAIALLGYRTGDVVTVRGGHSQVEIESIVYQPERAGHFDR